MSWMSVFALAAIDDHADRPRRTCRASESGIRRADAEQREQHRHQERPAEQHPDRRAAGERDGERREEAADAGRRHEEAVARPRRERRTSATIGGTDTLKLIAKVDESPTVAMRAGARPASGARS